MKVCSSGKHLPLKFRLFILKFKGAKGFEDTIFPPGKKKKKRQEKDIVRLRITSNADTYLADCTHQIKYNKCMLVFKTRGQAELWGNRVINVRVKG